MARRISRYELGAWLVKRNPAAGFELPKAGAVVQSWCVVPGYRSELMARGDRVILWVSGDGRRMARGIWGLGTVTGPVDQEPPVDQHGRAKVVVPLELAVLGQGVPAGELVAAGITDLEVQRMPQGSNPSWVSKEQLARLLPLLPPWPECRAANSAQ
ncbi:hypothetical protein [Kribbella sp. CA-247076]|uniref:hypothetical protein n=1 Tax=Kribbella sp. CA-247076 TaxID=3239941 RepID=UPI003D8CDA41